MGNSGNTSQLLRLTTVGSVDDGKSTLIGRLLHESKAILKDQLEAIEKASHREGLTEINFAYLLDGLKAEREQGITIDVAHRYFSSSKRKIVISDTPGHVQYTRNMVTGASRANVALILIDVRNGLTEQTKRHALISSLLRIPHFIICVNKMDLVEYREEPFLKIQREFENFSAKLNVQDVRFIPISALKGDNVCSRSGNMPWYQGPDLYYTLDTIHIHGDENRIDCRFPVQTVIRPHSDRFHDYRGFAGNVASGIFKKGDEVLLLPSEFKTRIQKIEMYDSEIQEAYPGMAVKLLLEDQFDLSRGDMIVRPLNQPRVTRQFDSMLVWFDDQHPLQVDGRYILRQTTRETICKLKTIHYKMDVHTLHRKLDDLAVGLNDVARVSIDCADALFIDPYEKNRVTGSFILIDPRHNGTVAAGMIL